MLIPYDPKGLKHAYLTILPTIEVRSAVGTTVYLTSWQSWLGAIITPAGIHLIATNVSSACAAFTNNTPISAMFDSGLMTLSQ